MPTPARTLALLCVIFVCATVVRAESPPIHVVGPDRPAVLDQITDLRGLTAIDLSPDGDLVAIARETVDKETKSNISILSGSTDEVLETTLTGRVRSLLFARDGGSLLAVLHHQAKRRPGVTWLLRITLDPVKTHRLMRIPVSTRDLDHWPERESLLIAARDAIRTFMLPDLRSGPMFLVPGENLAIASLAGGSLILVAQPEALVLVDLDDPSDREGLPVRDRIETPSAVADLAASADGLRALARTVDGTVLSVSVSPLRITQAGHAKAIGAVADPPRPVPDTPQPEDVATPPPSRSEPVTGTGTPRVDQPAAPDPVPIPDPDVERPDPASPPSSRSEPSLGPDAPPEDQPAAPGPVTESDPGLEPTVLATPPSSRSEPVSGAGAPRQDQPAAPQPVQEPDRGLAMTAPATPQVESASDVASPAEPPQLRGRIDGAGIERVRAVVLFGPDNILREAARIVPSPDGTWTVDGLEVGRYRIQLAGDGTRVLVTDPPFLVIEVGAELDAIAPAVRLLGEI